VDVLQELSLETTPADFVEKLNRRIEQQARLHHVKEQAPGEPVRAILTPWVHSLGNIFLLPLSVKIPLYAGVALLALVTLLMRVSPEKTKGPLALPPASVPLLPGPLSEPMAGVAGEIMQPVDTTGATPEKQLPPVVPLTSPTQTLNRVQQAPVWRVVGSEPTILRQQVKALVGQIAEAAIVQEEEHLLVISLPTEGVPALRQELSRLGETSTPEADVPANTPITVVRVKFVRSPSLVSPPSPEQPSSHS
jgi:hypothetical protein